MSKFYVLLANVKQEKAHHLYQYQKVFVALLYYTYL